METATTQTRCPFCSLACPIGMEKTRYGPARPAYVSNPEGPTDGRACYRGHYASALIQHPRRLVEARTTAKPNGRPAHDAAVEQAGRWLAEAIEQNSLGVLLSGNLPASELARAVRFFQPLMPAERIGIFIPPTDLGMLSGLLRSGCKLADEHDIKQAKFALAIGDVLGTHPVLAHPLLDLVERDRQATLGNLDCLGGRTMRFANPALRVPDGALAAAAGALALLAGARIGPALEDAPKIEDLLARTHLSRSDLERCLQLLQTRSPAVLLLTLPPGRQDDSETTAYLVGRLAKTLKIKVVPLLTSAGSAGAYAVCRALNAADTTAWLSTMAEAKDCTCVFCAGVDLAGILPDEFYAGVAGSWQTVIAADAMETLTTRRAQAVLPLAFWFETDGQMLDPLGRTLDLTALDKPPGGSLTLSDWLGQLAGQLGRPEVAWEPVDEGDIRSGLAGAAEPAGALPAVGAPDPPEGGCQVTARSETLDVYEGGWSRLLDWPRTIEAEPLVLIHPADAERMGIHDRQVITMRNETDECRVQARPSAAVEAQTVAIPAMLPAMRNFYSWRLADGRLRITPQTVSLIA
ncbi:MAG: molybdopterin-dependent oxidoreductase [Sedimentisphaerales bacterium]|nr:molybdopterin-dependent oxidoreductase [Sedimentisphaerales bacterium]